MRYNALNPFLKQKFGEKVYKITLHADVTCPNRDGTAGSGGCIYCNPSGSIPASFTGPQKGVRQQLEEGIDYIRKRHGANKFISYFQQHTNTYAPASRLAVWFSEAIDHPDIVGLAISTRPDCVSDEVTSLLSELNRNIFMWVELGLQSANDNTLKFLNRGHTVQDFMDAVGRLHEHNIAVCAHIILGLPGETDEDILNTTKLINVLKVEGVKIHNLHILKDTPLEKLHKEGKIKLLTLEEYAKKVVYALERLDPNILIHRFNSHAPRSLTVAPEWSINKMATFNAVEDELIRQDTRQGVNLPSARS